MSQELFGEYKGAKERDGVVAAAQVKQETIQKLSQITGGTAVWKRIRGGSMRLDGIILHNVEAKRGDYVVATQLNTFRIFKKEHFEEVYSYKGPLRDTVI